MKFYSQMGHYLMDSLENSSILHVLLFIFLRLMIIRYPLSRKGPMRFRKTLLLATWIIPFITKAPCIYLWQYPYFHFLYQNFQFHIFSTLPVVLIVFLYGVMLLTIRNKKRENQEMLKSANVTREKEIDRKTTLLISGLVLVLLVCYLPYLVHWSIVLKDHVSHFAENPYSKSACMKMINPSVEVLYFLLYR